MLEPCAMKVARTVLRGGDGSNTVPLPDTPIKNYFYLHGSAGVITVESNRLLIEKAGQPTQVVELPTEHAYTNLWPAIQPAYQNGSEPYYTATRALQDVAILEAVAQSIKAESGVMVTKIDR